jgi:hypothetical protein
VELGDIIVTIGRILNNLEKIQEERGVPNAQNTLVDNNIKNSSLGKKKESSSLSSSEKKKLSEVFSLFNQAFFAYQKKQTPDEAPKTLISKLEKQTKPKEAVPDTGKKKGFNLLDFLLPLVGGVALIGAAIPTLIASLFAKVGFAGDAMKVLGKVGLIGGLKLLGKTFLKKFALSALKKIPYIGGLISLGFAIKEFSAGRIIPGLLEIVSGLANFVPFVGPILSIGVDVLKAFLEKQGAFNEGGALSNANAWGTIKGWMSSIGAWIWDNALYIPIVGTFKRFGMAWDAFGSGDWKEGLKQVLYGLISIVPGGGFLIKGYEWLSSYLSSSKEEQQAQINEGGVMGTIKGWISSIGQYISDNALYLPIIGGIKRFEMAWDAFGSGNWGEGFKQLGLGLITFVGGGGLIKGIEWISSYLSGSKEEQQAQINEGGVMGTIKGWISSIGQYISDNAMNLPIIGGIKRFGMAWDAFTGGNIGEGFKLLGEGVLAFVGGGPLVSGFNMLAGWLLGGETEDTKSLSPDGSWKDRLKNWIKGKLHKLPAFLRKPLEWFGILDETDKEAGDNATVSTPIPKKENPNSNTEPEKNKLSFSKITDSTTSGLKKVDDTAGSMFSKITDSVGDGLNAVGDIAGGMFSSLKDLGKNAFDTAFKKFSEISPELSKFAGDTVGKLSNTISTMLPDIKPTPSTTIPNNKYEKLTENNTTENLQNDSNKYEMPKTYTRNETSQNKNEVQNNEAIGIGQIIERVSSNECKYLEALVNIGNLTLKEMRKTSSSGGEVSVIPQASPAAPTSNKNRIPLIDNRIGYANSVYALG